MVLLPRTALETTLLVRQPPALLPLPILLVTDVHGAVAEASGATERHVKVSVGEDRATQPEPHPAAAGLSLALVDREGVAERDRELLSLQDERQVTLLRGRHGDERHETALARLQELHLDAVLEGEEQPYPRAVAQTSGARLRSVMSTVFSLSSRM